MQGGGEVKGRVRVGGGWKGVGFSLGIYFQMAPNTNTQRR